MKKRILFVLVVFSVLSCAKEVSYDNDSFLSDECTPAFQLATFGEQTGHPFSISNVLSAFQNLSEETRAENTAEDIIPTHKYVRFIPTNYNEMDSVQAHSELDIYQYPLDCEITEGFVGIDNPFMVNGFPQYWCVVHSEYDLDAISCPYEIEADLWMPQALLEEETRSSLSGFEKTLLDELILEQGLDNYDYPETRASSSYPGGYVKYQDSVLGNTSIEGMVVEAYNFWHNYKATSSAIGYLDFGGKHFSGQYRYRVKFKLDDFAIRKEDNNSDLEYVTDKTTSPFYKPFTGEYAKYCVVFQAAQRYYYQPISIPRPPKNGFWKACLRICVYPNSASDDHWAGCTTIQDRVLLSDRPVITVWGRGSYGEYSSDTIYGTTVHELTHAMHYNMDKSLYFSVESRVKESLARGVECYLASERYPSYIHKNLYYSVNRYTGILNDLSDGTKTVSCEKHEDSSFNETTYSPPVSYYDGIDSAYTIPELVDASRMCKTPLNLYSRINSLYPGRIPDNDLYTAFNFWFDL